MKSWIVTLRTIEYKPQYKRAHYAADNITEACAKVIEDNSNRLFEIVKVKLLE